MLKKIPLIVIALISVLGVFSGCGIAARPNITSNEELKEIVDKGLLNNVVKLDLSVYEINDITPLASLTQLQELDVSKLGSTEHPIFDIAPLASLTKLRTLILNDNAVSDLSLIALLPNLKELQLRNNLITDITPLASLTKLEILDLAGNEISDFTPLKSAKTLKKLTLNSDILSQESLDDLQKALPGCNIMKTEGYYEEDGVIMTEEEMRERKKSFLK